MNAILQEIYSDEKIILHHSIDRYTFDVYFPEYNLAIDYTGNRDEIKRELQCDIIISNHLPKIIKEINEKINNRLRHEIMNLNTKLDIYDYEERYNHPKNKYGEAFDYVKYFGLDKAGYKKPDVSDSGSE